MSEVPVGPGTKVTLRFSLSLPDGELIDATESATFEVGDGSLLPGFESALFGMKTGDSATHEIAARHGFGDPNEDNIHKMKRINFNDMDLVEGLVVSFRDGEGSELPGVVKEIVDELVVVDFNHPLAGKDLLFNVEIYAVEQVSNEIIRG